MTSIPHWRWTRNLPCRWRCGPWFVGEIEEVEKVWLGCVAVSERRQVKSLFQEVNHGGVVHSRVSDVMFAREGRDDHVGYPEADLGGKAELRRSVAGICAGAAGSQVTMIAVDSGGLRCARQETIRVHGNGSYVAFQVRQRGAGVLVGMSRDRRNVVVRASPFVKAQKEDGIAP